jgi:hypothetical protein
MFKHDFIYSIHEGFVSVNKEIKDNVKKIKLTKFNENRNSYDLSKEINPLLLNIINTNLKTSFDKLKLNLKNCWVQQYKKNEYHPIHTHFSSTHDYSFVWFIDGDKNSAPLKFYDVGFPLIFTGKIIEFNFKPGVLLIFPGFIPHEVPINKGSNRLIISGNLI